MRLRLISLAFIITIMNLKTSLQELKLKEPRDMQFCSIHEQKILVTLQTAAYLLVRI